MGYYLWAQRYMGRAGIVISLTVVEFMTISNFVTNLQHHSALVETGGRRGSSGALNQLASYLDESGQRQPIAQDCGLKYNVPSLTQAIATREHVQLSHDVFDYVTYSRFSLSEKAPSEPGMRHALIAEPRGRDGAPIYQVYAAR